VNRSPDSTRRRPALAYLTTAYPSISHTFIRREILGLEALGFSIRRLAIRAGTVVVDAEDLREESLTLHLLSQPRSKLAIWALRGLWRAGLRSIGAFATATRLSRASERGPLRHVAYFVEALALLDHLVRMGVEHVHVHFGPNAAAVALLVKQLGGPRFSMPVHGPDEFDAAIGLSLRAKMRDAAFTIAISNYCAAQLQRWADPRDWPRIHVVHCTVGEEWFAAARPIADDADTFISVGRLSAQKGQLLLVEAFAAATRRGLRGRLVLVGDGELRAQIESRIEQMDMRDRITITGWCSGAEVRKHMLASRALVVSSFAEGLPVVIMESMALERPVISTQIMGIPELVRHGEHGWLTIAGDADALTAALLEADNTPVATLRDMGRRASERVRQRHSVSIESQKLSAVLERHAT